MLRSRPYPSSPLYPVFSLLLKLLYVHHALRASNPTLERSLELAVVVYATMSITLPICYIIVNLWRIMLYAASVLENLIVIRQ